MTSQSTRVYDVGARLQQASIRNELKLFNQKPKLDDFIINDCHELMILHIKRPRRIQRTC